MLDADKAKNYSRGPFHLTDWTGIRSVCGIPSRDFELVWQIGTESEQILAEWDNGWTDDEKRYADLVAWIKAGSTNP